MTMPRVVLGGVILAGALAAGCDAGGTCDEQTEAASKEVLAAFTSADLSCATDADCVIASGGSVCTSDCLNQVVSVEGAHTIQVAINGVEEGVCADFASQGCVVFQPPCPSPPRSAACLEGACADFPPATWASFAVGERRGAAAASWSTPSKCQAGEACTAWTVTPDGSIEKTESGAVSATSLSSADLATLDGILRSVAFRRLFATGPTCDPPPPDVIVSIQLENEYLITGIDVTGCALVGPADNDVMRVYELLHVY